MNEREPAPKQSFYDRIPISLHKTVPGLVEDMTNGGDFSEEEKRQMTTWVNSALTIACKSLPDVFDSEIQEHTDRVGTLLASKGTHKSQAWIAFREAMNDRKKAANSLRDLESRFAKKD